MESNLAVNAENKSAKHLGTRWPCNFFVQSLRKRSSRFISDSVLWTGVEKDT
jgi:hypothetical protein